MKRRVFLVVLDSYGIGYEPDAADFGDVGSNTLASIIRSEFYDTPNMNTLLLYHGLTFLSIKKKELLTNNSFK